MKETPELRSRIMRAVKGTDTVPERMVRSLVHRMEIPPTEALHQHGELVHINVPARDQAAELRVGFPRSTPSMLTLRLHHRLRPRL